MSDGIAHMVHTARRLGAATSGRQRLQLRRIRRMCAHVVHEDMDRSLQRLFYGRVVVRYPQHIDGGEATLDGPGQQMREI